MYSNHIKQAKLQLSRTPKKLPKVKIINKKDSIFDYVYDDIELEDYIFHDHIKASVSV